jgi:hypothetical protein
MARSGKFLIAGLVAAIAMVVGSSNVSAQCMGAGCVNWANGGKLVGHPHYAALNAVPNYGGPPAQLYQYPALDLFSNYYVGPGSGCYGGMHGAGYGAALYMAPHPVPPHVGHTFYTYEPFMPHEMLYRHHKTYHYYYNGGRGMTRASVHWR